MSRQPFFGQGPAPQIARMNMQEATAPGKHWGKAIESIGQTVGQAVEKHREHKKAKEKERDFIDSFEARISKSPEFAKSLGLNPDDSVEVRLAGKTYFNNPEARKLSEDFSRFQRDAQTARMNEQFMEQRGMLIDSLENKKVNTEDLNRFLYQDRTPEVELAESQEGPVPIYKMPGKFAERVKAESGYRPTGPTINVATGEVDPRTIPAPQAAQPLPERFQALLNSDLSPEAKAKGIAEMKAEAMAQQKFALEQQKAGMSLTPGETSFDQTFAKSLVEFNEPDVRKGMEQLRGAINSLENSDTLSGPFVSLLPNFFGDRVNPDAAQTREAIEEVVQRNLRLVLGAQFTEREGERLISRAYNPRLEEEQNIERVQRLFKSIEDAMNAKLRQKAYFQRYGTLKGHTGLEAEAAFWGSLGDSPSPASGQPSAGGATPEDIEALRQQIESKTALEVERAATLEGFFADPPVGSEPAGLPPSTPPPLGEVLKDADKLIQGFGPGQ